MSSVLELDMGGGGGGGGSRNYSGHGFVGGVLEDTWKRRPIFILHLVKDMELNPDYYMYIKKIIYII